jgi:ankyrin repeat protein
VSRNEELFEAIQAGQAPRVRALLDQDSTLANARNVVDVSALAIAAYWGQPEIVDLLLARGAEMDVFTAAALGDVEQVRAFLLKQPDLVSSYSPDGWTPLHLAAHFGQARVASLLLIYGAEVNARSRNGLANTALHAALAGRRHEVAALLLAHGADPRATQRGGWTPLHQAADHGDRALIEALLARGAEVNARNDEGQTPLALALARGHQEAATLLRAHGAMV